MMEAVLRAPHDAPTPGLELRTSGGHPLLASRLSLLSLTSPGFEPRRSKVLRVRRARDAHQRQRRREEVLSSCMRMASGAVGAVALAWLVWETVKMRPLGVEGEL